MNFENILVVCVGNICRSPMAEYFLRHEYPHLHIASAGISSLVGHPADQKAQICMQAFGIDMQAHTAQQLNDDLIKQADLILVMNHHQLKHLEHTWPYAKGKIFRLGHWNNKNISDPYQQEQRIFNDTCQLIQHCVADWKKYI